MATYGTDYRTGVARSGKIVVTGWSPTLSNTTTGAATSTTAPMFQFNGQAQNDDRLAKALRSNTPSVRVLRDMLYATLGGATDTAGTTYYRIKGIESNNNLGGRRTIETVAAQAVRTITAADKTAMQAIFMRTVKPSSYVADASKNGGGGKVGW